VSHVSPAGRTARAAAACLLAGVLLLALISASDAKSVGRTASSAKPTIVLIHGAWADGSSWSGVTARLQKAGYTVDVPPNPLRGLASDSAYVASYLKSIQGPIVLAGHSYGGAVITDAATGNANVKALVYVDAYIPDTGDTVLGLTSAKPGTTLDPTKAFNVVPFGSGAGEVDLYIKPSVFRADVAGDESPRTAAILAAEQRPLAASALQEKSTAPAWKTIPSWAVIGTEDMVLPPAEQVFMIHRAHSKTTKVKAAHLSMVTHPSLVTKIILRAVAATR
jgi:pimeloyl-ACP methyl ester carboxylesterase